MLRVILGVVLMAGFLAGCSSEGRKCDDGGEGGVVIDGVCL